MYGISNSQQQGGGGGSAASYKAIRASLTDNDWQRIPDITLSFENENAMTWAVSEQTGLPTKTQATNFGFVAGSSYKITVIADNVIYYSIAEAVDYGFIMLNFEVSDSIQIMFYDKWDASTMQPAEQGAMCMVSAEPAATSLYITNLAGKGARATISDSAIKVNSAVTMYINTEYKITGTKTNGSIELIASNASRPYIPYSLEIVGTDTEGLFEIINGYVPEITLPTVPQWHTIYEDTTGTGVTSIDNLTESLKGGELYRITIEDDFYIFCLHHDGDNVVRQENIVVEQLGPGNHSLTHNTRSLVYHEHSLSLAYELYYDITETGISNYDFSTAPGIKFTKLEVYR